MGGARDKCLVGLGPLPLPSGVAKRTIPSNLKGCPGLRTAVSGVDGPTVPPTGPDGPPTGPGPLT
jgi:hypothetical protein